MKGVKLTYIKNLNLLVCCLGLSGISLEERECIRDELTTRTGIEKVLIVEGSFEVI